MSQYMPNTAIASVPPSVASGIADHDGIPETRSEKPTTALIAPILPARCP
jgi:hypothetical protein